ncbi:disease resistance protein Roq1 [Cryptomeria japonica]|uniref:disease resistance protein Roq1 n=1 Tax=Cryptomeria japonica TaxID=3369 RepID=UPI0027DA02C2|nr:disease resistance protein Roq1 [Cryptomeria japonica]
MKIVPLEVAKHPVGLREAVVDFEKTISASAKIHPNVQIVGIWGMGGSGKTTLAKELYNHKYSAVEKSSFLFDIRDAASRSKLHRKQIQLLQDFGFKFNDKPFDNIEQGKRILSNHFRSLRVLIVLDDVDHSDQLEALLPAKDILGWGSLIIITTREKEVLTRSGISSIYKMKTLNLIHAKKLFCWHAFLQPFPMLGFEDLLKNLCVSNGLPLSLKVLGGQLYGCLCKDLWEDVLHKISKMLPDDIINRLRVSYDALDREEKQMFLDVACFFIGQDKLTAIAVWEGSGWSGLYGWERLINKCLVEFHDNNGIRMHDHLRDLGRLIAKAQLPCCLWSLDQIAGIPKQAEIRGMILNTATNDGHNFPRLLLNTRILLCGLKRSRRPFSHGLKVLVLGENRGNNLHIAKLSRELAWLSCTGIAHRNLPSWMPFQNLRVLELYNSQMIVGLWKDEDEAPLQLQVLIISGCPNLAIIPKSIGFLQKLKKMSLYYCNVESLPDEFCCLQNLEYLMLQSCKMLSLLPNCFGGLTKLRHLNLSFCDQLKLLPNSFKQLTLLQNLNLERCHMLSLQLDILENMKNLQYVNLGWCEQVEELPRHITNQACLSELYAERTRLRELPINIGELSKLRVMTIGSCQGCFQMQSLPDSIGSLNLLEILELENLQVESLPKSLRHLINLQKLRITNCPISELDFGCGPFTSWLSNLNEIHLERTKVSKISISEDCSCGLKTLILRYNDYLVEVDTLPTTVEYIHVDWCKLLRNISGIGGMLKLRRLKLWDCQELYTLPSFDRLASLEVFELAGIHKVDNIQGLQYCTSLEELNIDCKCWEITGMERWEHMQRLKRLQLVAKLRSAVEPCIQRIQKWPEETIICAKAVAGAEPLLNSSRFPNLSVLHSSSKKKISSCPTLRLREKRSSNGNAMLLCLIINCVSPRMRLLIDRDYNYLCTTKVEEGKWLLLSIFTQHSRCLTAQKFYIQEEITESNSYEDNNEVEKGLVLWGKEESVVESFHHLLALLAS